jgi:hypothetical protein
MDGATVFVVVATMTGVGLLGYLERRSRRVGPVRPAPGGVRPQPPAGQLPRVRDRKR